MALSCFDSRDLSGVPEPGAGVAVKLFSPPLSEGWAELHDPADSASFRFEFDPHLVTHLGLWVNYGGWAGAADADPYFNLGLEPCIGAPDTLDTRGAPWAGIWATPPWRMAGMVAADHCGLTMGSCPQDDRSVYVPSRSNHPQV
ncbi:MAG: hypothetical protein PVH80_05485 [Anaerolineae bacterium]|jgi:hypothetical protein